MATMTEVYEQARLLSEEEQRQLAQQLLGAPEPTGEIELDDPQKAHIEEVLLDRIDGPFVPFDDAFLKQLEERCMERVQNRDV